MSLPVLDFSTFYHGTATERSQLSKHLTEELRKHGAARLINLGIRTEMITECYAWSERFFKLPDAEKNAIPNERNADPQSGWSFVGSEKTSKLNKVDKSGKYQIAVDESVPQDLEDEKEHFDFARGDDPEYPSKWPTEASIPGFRNFMEAFLDACQDTGRAILGSLEEGLDLPPGNLTSHCATRVDEVRLNHYSPLPVGKLGDGKHQRAWPHTDFGLITLLFQDEAGGLGVENREKPGTFIPITRESPTEIAVLVSDSLEHLTNSYLGAGIHQVATPVFMEDVKAGLLPERFSIACFVKADRHVSVGPLDKYITDHSGEPSALW